jgi:hypothetical protein
MSSTPDPARIADYRARLAELVTARDTYRAQHNEHRVRQLNRQVQAQLKWIRRAETAAATP